MVHRVSARPAHANTRHDRLVVVHHLDHTSLEKRQEIVGQIARAIALVRVERVFPLAAPDDIARAWKPRPNVAIRIAYRETARVIEMQVGGKNDVDVIWRQARLSQRVVELSLALNDVDIPQSGVHLIAITA